MYTIVLEGLPALQRRFSVLGRDLPKALARGINTTAAKVVTAEQAGMKTHLDRPTPFTLNSLGVLKASAGHQAPAALLFVKPVAAEYLHKNIFGGTYKGLQPANIKLNRYGNLPKKKGAPVGLRGLITNKRQFVGSIKTHNGRKIFGLFQTPGYRRIPKPWRRSHPAKERPVKSIRVLVYASVSGRVAIMPYYRIAAKEVEKNLGIDIQNEIYKLLQWKLHDALIASGG